MRRKEKNTEWIIQQDVHKNWFGSFVEISIIFQQDKFLTKTKQKEIIKLLNFKNK